MQIFEFLYDAIEFYEDKILQIVLSADLYKELISTTHVDPIRRPLEIMVNRESVGIRSSDGRRIEVILTDPIFHVNNIPMVVSEENNTKCYLKLDNGDIVEFDKNINENSAVDCFASIEELESIWYGG